MQSTGPRTLPSRTLPQSVGHGVYARPRPSFWRRPSVRLIAALIVLIAALGVTRIAAGRGTGDIRLTVRVERQQAVSLDLASSTPRAPDVMGVNVFPADGTVSQDGAYGFMAYDSKTTSAIKAAHITMLRFPGGSWGEQHAISLEQLNRFLRLAEATGAQPLMQVRLTGNTPQEAAALVGYCNNRKDPVRARYPGVPFVRVRYWVLGNEPDLLPGETVAAYTQQFIAFARAMKHADPSIKIFGPEISQYTGGDVPTDSTGVPWLQGFLQRIKAYQHSHLVTYLDGVSIHRYPFGGGAIGSPDLLFAAADEWEYAIPVLRSQIHEIMQADLPIAVTELNTNSPGGATLSPLATALWWSATLGILLEQRVATADFFAFRGLEHPFSLLTSTGRLTPIYRAMQLWSHMAPDVLTAGTGGDPVSVFAASDAAHTTATIMIVNKTSSRAEVAIDGAQTFGGSSAISLNVPAYAMACVVLRQSGDNREYLYAPDASRLSRGEAGPVTVKVLG